MKIFRHLPLFATCCCLSACSSWCEKANYTIPPNERDMSMAVDMVSDVVSQDLSEMSDETMDVSDSSIDADMGCVPTTTSDDEDWLCDGLDNDCDGVKDEYCSDEVNPVVTSDHDLNLEEHTTNILPASYLTTKKTDSFALAGADSISIITLLDSRKVESSSQLIKITQWKDDYISLQTTEQQNNNQSLTFSILNGKMERTTVQSNEFKIEIKKPVTEIIDFSVFNTDNNNFALTLLYKREEQNRFMTCSFNLDSVTTNNICQEISDNYITENTNSSSSRIYIKHHPNQTLHMLQIGGKIFHTTSKQQVELHSIREHEAKDEHMTSPFFVGDYHALISSTGNQKEPFEQIIYSSEKYNSIPLEQTREKTNSNPTIIEYPPSNNHYIAIIWQQNTILKFGKFDPISHRFIFQKEIKQLSTNEYATSAIGRNSKGFGIVWKTNKDNTLYFQAVNFNGDFIVHPTRKTEE